VTDHLSLPFWKRATDLVFVVAALPLFGLLAALMAIVTRIWSPGGILFRQERVGCRGRLFVCYKFRTMSAGAAVGGHQAYLTELISSGGPMQKMDARGDSRLIPGGWFLRATGLDELPQLINVARGEMSLVGPRPCIPYEFESYLPWHRQRAEARPGLTGLWQVSGKNRTTFDEMVRFDIAYAKGRTPWMDAKIIVLTIPALLIQVSDLIRGAKRLPAPKYQPSPEGNSPASTDPVRIT
jgi:lipopolysaccharide/colanic/teichoic acid biosynthesis glycosyltransferase